MFEQTNKPIERTRIHVEENTITLMSVCVSLSSFPLANACRTQRLP